MLRYAILGVCATYFVLLAGLAVAVQRAAPGPEGQAITGVGIGPYWERSRMAYLSGRRLDCVPDERDGLRGSRCRVAIAGETLEIRAWRNPPRHPNQLGGQCEARYAGKPWSCHIGSRHVSAHFFAYLIEPLGLSEGELDAVRREYPIENLGEEPFMVATLLLPLLTAVFVAGAVLAGTWPRPRRDALYAAVAFGGALAALPGTFFAVLLLTSGLWD